MGPLRRVMTLERTRSRKERTGVASRCLSVKALTRSPDERATATKRDARFLILVEKFLRKSNHGGGDQENEPMRFERMRSVDLKNLIRNFIAFLLNVYFNECHSVAVIIFLL